MGMAASQARLLQLSARMSNCEYEGQQINQQRTILANESANLFNQMLVMQVPTVPSSSDYTTVQYTFTDGTYTQVLEDYYQIGSPDSEYNYVVTHSYEVERYTGSMKKLSDPQVQFTSMTGILTPESYDTYQKAIYQSYARYQEEMKIYQDKFQDAEDLLVDVDMAQVGLQGHLDKAVMSEVKFDAVDEIYSVVDKAGVEHPLTSVTPAKDADGNLLDSDPLAVIIKSGALKDGDTYFSYEDPADGTTKYLSGTQVENFYKGAAKGLNAYSADLTDTDTLDALDGYNTAVATYEAAALEATNYYDNEVASAYNEYTSLIDTYNESTQPNYIGNCELTEIPIGQMEEDQLTELQQVIYDLAKEGIASNLPNCFDANGDYKGGIFTFQMYGERYYTTYDDLYTSYMSVDHDADSNNGIDRQSSMPYYSATYVKTNISKTEKALLETDSTGRFMSIRLEDDSVKYTLNAETITDEDAYTDAMNQYYYQTAEYQKAVADVNAKTSIIQQEDRTLELRLEQLDTERNTLSTEMEAVQKVLSENIERTYKTFSD